MGETTPPSPKDLGITGKEVPEVSPQSNNPEDTRIERTPEEIRRGLYRSLPESAKELIGSERYENSNDPYRDAFMRNPNSPEMHSKWHQWGIITHTVMTGQYMEKKVPKLFERWFGKDVAESRFGLRVEMIDNVSKWDLLTMAVPIHDYGKFAKRQLSPPKDKGEKPDFSFNGHEVESGAIVRAWQNRFEKLGLTDKQVGYLARCAELHYELGKLRDTAKKSKQGYSIAFTETDVFQQAASKRAQANPDMAREMGIFFIADSLGKTDLHHGIETESDQEIEQLREQITSTIRKRKLSETLLPAALQLGVNMASGRRYLALLRNPK